MAAQDPQTIKIPGFLVGTLVAFVITCLGGLGTQLWWASSMTVKVDLLTALVRQVNEHEVRLSVLEERDRGRNVSNPGLVSPRRDFSLENAQAKIPPPG